MHTKLAVALVALMGVPVAAQTFTMPAHFEAVTLPGSFNTPVDIVFAPDGTLFVVEKPGTVRVLDPAGVEQGLVFIDLVAEVNNDWDRGLLGLALHPDWVPDGGGNSWVYLLYTVSPVPPSDNGYNTNQKYSFSRLTRWHAVMSGSSIVADLASRQVLIGNQLADGSVPDGIASIHNSHSNGEIVFAPDGTLLLACGDGAHYDFKDTGGADNPGFDDFIHPTTALKGPTPKVQDAGAFRAQDLRSLSGKVLRLDPETGLGLPSNPFFDGDPASNASKVWALGLRNPFRMAFAPDTSSTDPAAGQPGVLLLGDVGWNLWEEVNVSRFGGENFGWPCFEGFPQQSSYQNYFPTDPSKVDCDDPTTGLHTDPSLAWHHSNANALAPAGKYMDENGVPKSGFAGNCSIGGTLYTGGSYPAKYVGRLFFADYVRQWIKTLEFDASWNLVAVRDFADSTGPIVEVESHPLTGDLYVLDITAGKVKRIGYGANLTPVALASASPLQGPAPLLVNFTGSSSFDPDPSDTLTFDWDFGDGSLHSSQPDVSHVYATDDNYEARLVVTDPLGLAGETTIPIVVGNAPPVVTIETPLQGQILTTSDPVALLGSAVDPDGDAITYTWIVDLYHDIHIHPAVATYPGNEASFPLDEDHADGDLVYYRMELRAEDTGGHVGSAHVFVFPDSHVLDVAGTAKPISRMDELVPPTPTGGGNQDIEVARDAVLPPVGSGDSYTQWDSFHGGQQGNDDWIGFELLLAAADEFRFTGFTFQEGKHFVDGGWWQDLRVEVRENGDWKVAPNLVITPAYPFALSGQPFFDGVNFQSFDVAFDPMPGDAVRLRGNPGGSANFISVGELRCRAVEGGTASPWHDITAQATTILSKVDGLLPSGPFGGGNKSKETLRNGTFPPPGSTSYFGQYDTYHSGQQGNEDWVGYEFPGTRTLARLVFQEGLDNQDGGAFDTLGVQVQSVAGGPWSTVPGVTVSPPYPGLNGAHYETFELLLPPTLARAVRLAGDPAGTVGYISVGELRVFEPALPDDCGFVTYGLGLPGSNTLTLGSDTPPGPGLPIELHVMGAAGPASGALLLGFGEVSLPLAGGTLLVDPVGAALIGLSFDAAGTCALVGALPSDTALEGVSVWLQAAAFGQPAPWSTRLSNGLKMTLCGSG